MSSKSDLYPYLLTVGATLSFSSASLVFTQFSKRVSVLWMNTVKAAVALVLLAFTIPILFWMSGRAVWIPPENPAAMLLLFSGVLGLGIGDLFLLSAFTRIGVSRTLMLYGFQPLILGLGGFLFFDQSFENRRLLAIVFLIACLLVFSLERYRETKSWELRGLTMAIIGVVLDSCGLLTTRLAFDQSPQTTPLEGHLIRCGGALFAYALIAAAIHFRRRLADVRRGPSEPASRHSPVIGLISNFRKLETKSRWLLFLGCFGGTYLSLCLYLTAIQIGHLASIAAIAITGPMFAALLESVILRRRPNRYLIIAFAFFISGFAVLVL